jgi:hypothetical protein
MLTGWEGLVATGTKRGNETAPLRVYVALH